MDRGMDFLQGLAILAGVNALLHVLYAASGGIADPPWRWLLALAAVASAILAGLAGWGRAPWWVAWVSWPLMALPVAATFPAAAASLAGLVVVLLVLATLAGLIMHTARRRHRPPTLSPA